MAPSVTGQGCEARRRIGDDAALNSGGEPHPDTASAKAHAASSAGIHFLRTMQPYSRYLLSRYLLYVMILRGRSCQAHRGITTRSVPAISNVGNSRSNGSGVVGITVLGV